MAATDQSVQAPAAKRNLRAERLREFWHYFSENNGAVAGLAVVAAGNGGAVTGPAAAVFAGVVSDYMANWPNLTTFDFNKLERIAKLVSLAGDARTSGAVRRAASGAKPVPTPCPDRTTGHGGRRRCRSRSTATPRASASSTKVPLR